MKTKFSTNDPPEAVLIAIEDALDCGKEVVVEKNGKKYKLRRKRHLTLIWRVG